MADDSGAAMAASEPQRRTTADSAETGAGGGTAVPGSPDPELGAGAGAGGGGDEAGDGADDAAAAAVAAAKDAAATAASAATGLWGFASSAFKSAASTVATEIGGFADALREENRDMFDDEKGEEDERADAAAAGAEAGDAGAGAAAAAAAGGDGNYGGGGGGVDDGFIAGMRGVLKRAAAATQAILPDVDAGGEEAQGEDDDPDAPLMREQMTRMARLYTLQNSRDTFMKDPREGVPGSDLPPYPDFLVDFRAHYEEEWRAKTAAVLQSQSDVRSFFVDLVPDSVPEWQFWCRYIYRVRKLDAEDAVRKRLLETDEEKLRERLDASLSIAWDDDDEDEDDDEDDDEEEVALRGDSGAAAATVPAAAAAADDDEDDDWDDLSDFEGGDEVLGADPNANFSVQDAE